MLEYQLLSPEEDIEELFPYRRVWRTLITEMSILLLAVAAIIVATRAGLLQDVYSAEISVGLTLLPIAVFYLLSVRRETQALQARAGLLTILVLSLVVANGVALPIINLVITPDRWLTESGFFSRIIGYMLTVGILAEFVKYAVVRYTTWPVGFRERVDGVAYSIPAALGYATIVNLHFVLDETPTLSAAAMRILVMVYIHITVGAIMGYFLSEMAIGAVSFFWLPLGLFISAFISGLFFAFRQVATVSGLSSRDIGALFLAMGFAIIILGALAFVIESADERMAAKAGIRRIR